MLHDPQLPETVAKLLAAAEVPPCALVLEITESSLMADPVRADAEPEAAARAGRRMSIDDFGTGYSSLASLKNLSVDELKIDQSFVQAMATDAERARDRAGDHRPGRRAEAAGRGRRRRGPRHLGRAGRPRLRRGAGLLPQPAAGRGRVGGLGPHGGTAVARGRREPSEPRIRCRSVSAGAARG